MNLVGDSKWNAVRNANTLVQAFSRTVEELLVVGGRLIKVSPEFDDLFKRTQAVVERFMNELESFRAFEPHIDLRMMANQIEWVGTHPIPTPLVDAARKVALNVAVFNTEASENRGAIAALKDAAEEAVLQELRESAGKFEEIVQSLEYQWLLQSYDGKDLLSLQANASQNLETFLALSPDGDRNTISEKAMETLSELCRFFEKVEECLPTKDTV
ncbi:MAG: hypothetical protein JSS32_07335 [Verrucomicrobia bacterium]|nr:hypothetical protein [Verrucomicrobiota bacterium]